MFGSVRIEKKWAANSILTAPIIFVSPLGIEPRAKEPESFILSIKLRALFDYIVLCISGAKLVSFWKFRTFAASKSMYFNLIN